MTTTKEAAEGYLARGWFPVPVPKGSKAPVLDGWQELRITEGDLRKHFGNGSNIGVLLGVPPANLIDVDLDCPQAVVLAGRFLAKTNQVSGHQRNPRSHWWYRCDPLPATRKYVDPTDKAVLVEVRSTGAQTIVWPSLHPDGDLYQWDEDGDPAAVAEDDLLKRVKALAACCLLAKHWPGEGSRQDAALALAGAMLLAGRREKPSANFIAAAAQAADDEEATKRAAAVEHTKRRLDAGETVTGIPTLIDLIDEKVVTRAIEWLGLRRAETEPIAERPQAGPVLKRMADVQPEAVSWLWQPYLPVGKLSLLIGDPEAGKSWVSLALATAISRGVAPPGGVPGSPANVVILTAEDGLADTVRVRLDAMGADVSRVFAFDAVRDEAGERPFSLVRDLAHLETALAAVRPVLVTIDPLSAYIGNVDAWRDNEVRGALAPLAAVAERYRVAILGIAHLTKTPRVKALYRVLGSVAFSATARSVMLVAEIDEPPGERVMAHAKCNLAPRGTSWGFSLAGGLFAWTGQSDLTADDLLTVGMKEPGGAVRVARDFLVRVLADGPVAADDVQEKAQAEGISERTLDRAKRDLGVKSVHVQDGFGGGKGYWAWELPHKGAKNNIGTLVQSARLCGPMVQAALELGATVVRE